MHYTNETQEYYSSTNTKDPQINALEQIDDLISASKLAQATDLARIGNYAAAEDLLKPLIEKKPTHATLDLLARIKAQQGELNAARVMWERALSVQPGCPECIAGIARIDSMQKGKSTTFKVNVLLRLVPFLAILFAFVLLARQVMNLKNGMTATSSDTPVIASQIAKQQAELLSAVKSNQSAIEDLQQGFSDLLRTPVPTPAEEAPDSILQQIKIEGKGLESTFVDDQIQIKFSNGLFRYNWSFQPEALPTLKGVGTQLEPWADEIKITVVGFTDETEKEQAELPYLRSSRVIETLTDHSTLPTTIFSIAPSETLQPPYPNDTAANRLRNRTVILIITASNDQE